MFEQIKLKNKINFAKKGPFNKIDNNVIKLQIIKCTYKFYSQLNLTTKYK